MDTTSYNWVNNNDSSILLQFVPFQQIYSWMRKKSFHNIKRFEILQPFNVSRESPETRDGLDGKRNPVFFIGFGRSVFTSVSVLVLIEERIYYFIVKEQSVLMFFCVPAGSSYIAFLANYAQRDLPV